MSNIVYLSPYNTVVRQTQFTQTPSVLGQDVEFLKVSFTVWDKVRFAGQTNNLKCSGCPLLQRLLYTRNETVSATDK